MMEQAFFAIGKVYVLVTAAGGVVLGALIVWERLRG